MADNNVVFIGKKNTKSYVLAVISQINNGAKEVLIKARGRAISKAVDVAEMVRHRFLQDLKVDRINISTEEVSNEDGSKLKVSAIEIVLKK